MKSTESQKRPPPEPEPLSNLPILNSSNRKKHKAWHDYINDVYGENFLRENGIIDLNTFSWFYWTAPLRDRLKVLHLSKGNENVDLKHIAPGTPWTGAKAAWMWGPEHITRRLGFFVWRRPQFQVRPVSWRKNFSSFIDEDELRFANGTRLQKVEVMRIGPNEHVQRHEAEIAWFFNTIGSGIYLKLDPGMHSTAFFTYMGSSSAPRTEVLVPKKKGSSRGFWDTGFEFVRADGRKCKNDFDALKILSCRGMSVPIWDLESADAVLDGSVNTNARFP